MEPKLTHEAYQHECSVALLKAGKAENPNGLPLCLGAELVGEKETHVETQHHAPVVGILQCL